MFGINFWEFMLLLLVALAVFGPDRLPDVARQAGRFMRQARTMLNNARSELDRELGSEFSDLNLNDLDPRKAVKKYVFDVMDEDDPSVDGHPTGGQEPLGVGERPPYDYDAT
ncbi:MAG TPA: sec-independent translocase [Nocardioidaceae bacterium]|nr:sec-independent translocase [Nocardioidaceae bacterium]